jgi:hypothetical protein
MVRIRTVTAGIDVENTKCMPLQQQIDAIIDVTMDAIHVLNDCKKDLEQAGFQVQTTSRNIQSTVCM